MTSSLSSLRLRWFACVLLLAAAPFSSAVAGLVIDTVPAPSAPGTFSAVTRDYFLVRGRGLTFTTGTAAGTHIDDLSVQINPTAYGVTVPFHFTAAIYAATGGLPTGSPLFSGTFNVVDGSSGTGLMSLGSLGTFSLSANTGYALTFSDASTDGFFLGGNPPSGGNPASKGTTSSGYVVNGGLYTDGSAWTTDSNTVVTAIQLSVSSAPAVVPEPTTYAMALAGLACGGFSIWRRRTRA